MSRRDSCWRDGSRAGCPADVSHDTVRVNRVEVRAAAGSDGPRAGPGEALAATTGTSDSPWRDQRAIDSGLRRLTQVGRDRTPGIVHAPRGSMWLALCGWTMAPG